MARERPSILRSRMVTEYVRDRMQREGAGQWGYNATMAKATEFTPAHVSNVHNGKARVGEDFGAALAEFWKIDGGWPALVELARAWNAERLAAAEKIPHYPAREEAVAWLERRRAPQSVIDQLRRNDVYNTGYFRARPRSFWMAEAEELLREAAEQGDEAASLAVRRLDKRRGATAKPAPASSRTLHEPRKRPA